MSNVEMKNNICMRRTTIHIVSNEINEGNRAAQSNEKNANEKKKKWN